MTKTLTPRDHRLAAELKHMKQLAQHSSFFHYTTTEHGLCPEEYEVVYSCKGLVRKPGTTEDSVQSCIGCKHKMRVYLPAEYPLLPPQIYLKTPVFHPNIKYLPDWEADLEKQLGGAEQMKRVLLARPDLQDQINRAHTHLICLDGIKPPREKGNYVPRLTLYDIFRELGEMIMFQHYNLDDPLDRSAAEWTVWAQRRGNILPIDKTQFLDRLGLREVSGEVDIWID